ncbi:OPT oligopeptide transporter protein-domain-containing protein [Bisporella sp. PMI_857]|nr:OPT oligopeptide transporter protein-domain-containing protein [Bisporella sp. PMI_857]
MTPSRSAGGQGQEVAGLHAHNTQSRDIPLSSLRHKNPHVAPQDDEEDLDPESDTALLRKHHADSDDDAASTTTELTSRQHISPLQKLLGLMSKAPLLLRSAPGFGTGSYGAAGTPIGASTDNSEDDENDHLRSGRHKKRANGSGLRNTVEDRSQSPKKRRRPSKDFGYTTGRSVDDAGESLRRELSLDGRYGMSGVPIPTAKADKGDEAAAGKLGEGEDIPDGDGTLDGIASDDEDPWDNSPYPQVRASVSAIDNTSLSINTPRMWALSMLFAILGSSTNLFFSLRYPSVSITPVIALLLVHPLGLIWDQLLKRKGDPDEAFEDGVRSRPSSELDVNMDANTHNGTRSKPQNGNLRNLRLWLAQGRWNEKEHSCVYISSNVSFGFAFATDVIVEQTQFYNQKVSITYQLLLILSTQILGYTFAGLARRFLVRPGGMIWPGTLMSAAMFTTLHKEENTIANGWKITRWKFFFVVWLSAFIFYFLPGLIFPALSYFSVITWIWPKSVVVANLFGVASGLGLFPVTFDWTQIAYIGSPLLTPFWAAMNVVGGLVIVMWIIAPIAYYKNVFNSSYMPILSSSVFDNTGNIYNVSRILTPDFLFDKEAYHNYSRVFLPITYMLSYGLQFAALASLLSHTACWHGKDIWRQWIRSLKEVKGQAQPIYKVVPGSREGVSPDRPSSDSSTRRSRVQRTDSHMENIISQEDVHNRLMKKYKDAPLSWYLLTFVSMTAVGMFVCEYYPVHLPWYGLLLALGICTVLFIPIGIVMAITNQHSSIYLICQLVCGAVFPGRPVANMVFVTYGYISSAQGIKFSSDLKLGHYMKIPPRILFSVQMVATIVSSITQIGVLNWMFANVPGICTPEAINGFTCPLARVHFNGSILWGVVGPGEFFGPSATYHILVWCFPIGAIAPIILWLYARKRKSSIVRKINLPVLFGSLSWIPPATGLNFSVWALVCYIFNYVIKRRATAWWAKYTMTLSAALDSGLAFGIVVVFFGFVFPGWTSGFKWWGTEVYKQGCDWNACPYKTVPEGGHFGPDTW